MMGVITGYSRRTAAIGSGGGGGAINTIYSASDTIIDNARTVTLKSGTTATQNLQILNSSGNVGYYFDGTGSVAIGTTTTSGKLTIKGSGSTSATTTALFQNSLLENTLSLRDDGLVQLGVNGSNGIRFDAYGRTSFAMLQYLAPSTSYASLIYNSLNQQLFSIESNGAVSSSRPTGGTSYLNYNNTINFQAEAVGDNFAYTSKNSLGNYTMYLRNISNVGTFELMNSAGVTQLYLAGGNGSYILNNLAIGVSSASAKFDVKGSGSTSATTTALFQNSSSVAALKVKDDLYCIFRAKNAAIPDGDLSNNEMSFYLEEATNDLHFKVKYSTGTVKSGKINLT